MGALALSVKSSVFQSSGTSYATCTAQEVYPLGREYIPGSRHFMDIMVIVVFYCG